ncbi:hypothetical protein [Flavobacterium sandaracinum]|uniref:Uncharacterized protein n=1 Tax=Flavobacterium sandaracinum TaxID=2541733 RepID=A0A4R5CMG3_9FLAO|nr:hypothetical protein [Flavobacterium sandaracinum]TDE01549.1 hypothetical protein E0F91_14440 [Flavobacterium sandaracinum]
MIKIIEKSFFFLHRQIQKINSLLTKKTSYILAPLLPIIVVINSALQLYNGNFILFHLIILILGVVFSFLLTVSSIYFLKGDNIFNRYNREKSNSNLSQFQNTSKSSNNISEKKVADLIEANRDAINYYYVEFKKIELFNDDTLLSDFQSLIANCLKKSNNNYFFELEISAQETHGFINEFMIPFLIKLDSSSVIPKKCIASLLQYKKAGKYIPVNEKSLSDKNRITVTLFQKKVYESVQKM